MVRELNYPFRKSYLQTAKIINFAERNGKSLSDLTINEINKVEPKLKSDVLKRNVKLRVSNAALRTVDYKGGIDFYLQGVKSFKLSQRAKKLKNQIILKNH